MTTMRKISKRCAVCKAEANYCVICSCSTMGCMMDTRPIFMGDDPMRYIDRCECGYVAEDISEKTTVTKEDVELPEYRQIIRHDSISNRYAAIAFLRSLKGMHGQSASAYLRAAWMADDEGDGAAAADMRRKFLEEISKKQCRVEDIMIKADVLRCLGMFDQAKEAIALAEKMNDEDGLVPIIEKQKKLISEGIDSPSIC